MIQVSLRVFPLGIFLYGFAADPVLAQVPGNAVPSTDNQDVVCAEAVKPSDLIVELRDLYNKGDWYALQLKTRDLLKACRFKDDKDLGLTEVASKGLDLTTNYVFVVLATTNTAGDPMVLRYLVTDPAPRPFTNRLPGVEPELIDVKQPVTARPHVFQVLLSPIRGAVLSTAFVSTEQPSPLEAQVPDFVKAILDPSVVLPLLQGVLAPVTAARAAGDVEMPKKPLLGSLSRLSLPHKRGEIKIQDVIRVPAAFTADAVRTIVVGAHTLRRDIGTAPPLGDQALKISEALYAELLGFARQQRFAEGTCDANFWGPDCWKAEEAQLTTAAQAICGPAGCSGENLAVLERYKKVLPSASPVSGTTSIVNAPLHTVSLGAMTGVLLSGTTTAPRAKVDSGKIAEDPLPRGINIVAVQFHPPHDPTLLRPSQGERWRAFVGAAITPSFGLTVGGGWAPVRNLSLNIGYAVMLIRTPKATETFGAAPIDKHQPFDAAAGHGAFFALGYKFK